ncbi:MAG: ArsR/SmtB family transcription factor, partial [Gemmatimonadales bacterium]
PLFYYTGSLSLRASMKKTTAPAYCADKMKVLSDVTRLSVLEELMTGPKNVTELNSSIKIDQSLLSHHLKVLRDAGLVKTTRDGKAIRYEIAPEAKSQVAGKALNLGCCQISFVGLPKRR